MCVAIPSRVVGIHGTTATVERFGERLDVNLMMLSEAVEPGDFLIIQARTWAVEKIDAEEAERTLELFREVFASMEAKE